MGNEQFRRRLIIALRVFALFTAIASVTAVARAMNALPWVVDGLLALACRGGILILVRPRRLALNGTSGLLGTPR
ncbi:MAG: hypothetical protein LC753_12780 [Acidobacteria bacterium]|nr:hypothetical protein [Acidobacteriota bacterium]